MVLAHDRPGTLRDQVANLRLTSPGCEVVVFNGGTDPHLLDDLDVEQCSASTPLRHRHLARFHGLALEWVGGRDRGIGHLVALDSDVLALRPGFAERLADRGADYLATGLSPVLQGTPWVPGRRFLRAWPHWQPMFGTEHPGGCFNPVQVFGRRYVDGFSAWPHREQLLLRLAATRVEALEEIVWPTLAHALDLRAERLPGGRAMQLRRHAPTELARHLEDTDEFFVHKVGAGLDDPDRKQVRAHLRGESHDAEAPVADYWTTHPSRLRVLAGHAKDVVHVLQRRR